MDLGLEIAGLDFRVWVLRVLGKHRRICGIAVLVWESMATKVQQGLKEVPLEPVSEPQKIVHVMPEPQQ